MNPQPERKIDALTIKLRNWHRGWFSQDESLQESPLDRSISKCLSYVFLHAWNSRSLLRTISVPSPCELVISGWLPDNHVRPTLIAQAIAYHYADWNSAVGVGDRTQFTPTFHLKMMVIPLIFSLLDRALLLSYTYIFYIYILPDFITFRCHIYYTSLNIRSTTVFEHDHPIPLLQYWVDVDRHWKNWLLIWHGREDTTCKARYRILNILYKDTFRSIFLHVFLKCNLWHTIAPIWHNTSSVSLSRPSATLHGLTPKFSKPNGNAVDLSDVGVAGSLPLTAKKFRAQCNSVRSLISKAKSSFLSNLVTESSTNPRTLWKTLNTILHRNPSNSFPESPDASSLANTFLDFFKDKIDRIRTKFLPSHSPDPFLFPPAPPPKMINFIPATLAEIYKLISASESKQCPLDSIPTFLLKLCFNELGPIITNLVNLSLSEGIFPSSFKQALVQPLLKKTISIHWWSQQLSSNFKPHLHFQNSRKSRCFPHSISLVF